MVKLLLIIVAGMIFVSAASAREVKEVTTMSVMATAYCLQGTTSTGTYVKYGTVAVDPHLIPYYSRLYIPGYGYARALDTGSAIVGNHVDLWFSSCYAARQWGVKHITIKVYRR